MTHIQEKYLQYSACYVEWHFLPHAHFWSWNAESPLTDMCMNNVRLRSIIQNVVFEKFVSGPDCTWPRGPGSGQQVDKYDDDVGSFNHGIYISIHHKAAASVGCISCKYSYIMNFIKSTECHKCICGWNTCIIKYMHYKLTTRIEKRLQVNSCENV